MQRLRHARVFPGRRRPRPDSREPALCARPGRTEDFPAAELLGRQRPELYESGPGQPEAPRRDAADGLPGHEHMAGHWPVHEQQGRHPAGVRDDVGRQRQRPAPDPHALRAPRLELHGLRDRHAELLHVARVQLGTRREFTELSTPAAAVVPCECGRVVIAAAVSQRRPGRLRALVRLPRGQRHWAHGQRRPVPNRSGPVHQPEHHARRHRQPDESVGSAFLEGRLLLPAQLQAAEHLRQLQQPDRFRRQLEQPVRHGVRLRERGDGRVQFLPAGLEVRASRMELQEHRVVRAGQLEAQRPFHARLRRAILRADAAVGHDAAGFEFPAGQVRSKQGREAVHAGVRRRRAGRGLRAPWDRPDADHRRYHPDAGQYR